jgi:hypothetical protein
VQAPPGGWIQCRPPSGPKPLLWGAVAALAAACAAPPPPPPPDPDATQATSRAISYASPHLDRLDCRKDGAGDCTDWFNFQPTAPGTLRLVVSPAAPPAEAEAGAPVPFELAVADESGGVIGRASAGAEPAAVSLEVRDPQVFYASVTVPAGTPALDYQLSFESQLRTAPPPFTPPPTGKTQRWTVLEVEKRGDTAETRVLIDGGRRDALKSGMRGKLVDGQRTLGRIVVIEVFDEGSRVRVEGPLSGDITPETVAEIEVPADGR